MALSEDYHRSDLQVGHRKLRTWDRCHSKDHSEKLSERGSECHNILNRRSLSSERQDGDEEKKKEVIVGEALAFRSQSVVKNQQLHRLLLSHISLLKFQTFSKHERVMQNAL